MQGSIERSSSIHGNKYLREASLKAALIGRSHASAKALALGEARAQEVHFPVLAGDMESQLPLEEALHVPALGLQVCLLDFLVKPEMPVGQILSNLAKVRIYHLPVHEVQKGLLARVVCIKQSYLDRQG